MDEKAGYHVFQSKNFGLTVPKKFVEEPVCVSEKFGYRKFSSKGGGMPHGFEKILNFISQDRKNFAREPFCVAENFW